MSVVQNQAQADEQFIKEKEAQFLEFIQNKGLKTTRQRSTIVQVFFRMRGHISVEELLRQVKRVNPKIGYATVYRTLHLLVESGIVEERRFGDGLARYEGRNEVEHHDHMICTKCGRIIEFKEDRLEKYQIQIAASRGFHMLRHKMEIYGICADCLKERSRQMPLTMAKAGEQLLIREISGGASVRLRLLAMGLREGDHIEVITNDGQGQLAIAADLKRYALGRGLAQKIVVEPSEL